MSTPIRPASEVATLIVENITLYSKEKGFENVLPRFKMNEPAIRRISGHVRILPESYVEELIIEMQQLHWIALRYDPNSFMFMANHIPKNWTTLTAKRVVAGFASDEAEYDTWTLPELQAYAQRNKYMLPEDDAFESRHALIQAILDNRLN
jgi:hypothetical protein